MEAMGSKGAKIRVGKRLVTAPASRLRPRDGRAQAATDVAAVHVHHGYSAYGLEVALRENACAAQEHGFTEDEVDPYTGQSFGSWYVTVAHQPRLRVIWDGKDGWMIIQRETNRPYHWDPHQRDWDVLWVAKQPDDQTAAEEVVIALVNLREFASDVRGEH